MKIHTHPQRSDAWFKARLGIPTASKFDRIITPKGARSGQARAYLHQLAYERITDRIFERKDISQIPHVKHGIDHEDTAVKLFKDWTSLDTQTIGFITNDDKTVGCSPDRLVVGRNECVEIKCPTGPIHVGYLLDGLDAYKAQIQGQLLVGKFRRAHFFSWHPELPPYYKIVDPDPAFIAMLQKYLEDFERELAEGVAYIRRLGSWPSNAPSAFPEPDDAA